MRFRALVIFFILSICACCAEPVQVGAQPQAAPPITQPQNVAFEACTKMFAINKEKLFYLTLGAVNANRFNIEEIQTQNGYIIFSAANNKYLATIMVYSKSSDNALLEIMQKATISNISIDSMKTVNKIDGVLYELDIWVKNLLQLNNFMRDLNNLSYIDSVERFTK